MELSQMLAMVDHTLLKPESTWAQIKAICDDAMKYHTATVHPGLLCRALQGVYAG